jgi:hypothetical protein
MPDAGQTHVVVDAMQVDEQQLGIVGSAVLVMNAVMSISHDVGRNGPDGCLLGLSE